MAGLVAVVGLGRIIANLRARNANLGTGFMRGAKRAGLALQRESQRLVPVEYGQLKNSAYTRAIGTGLSATIYVGYTANYALYVHEAVQMKLLGQPRPSGQGKYWDPIPKATAKFLERPARTMAPQLRQIIRQEMKI